MFKKVFLISIYIAFTTLSFAQNRYHHTQISLNEGLSNSSILSILRDSDGILWTGTKHGLNRYNGYELENYFYSSNDSLSIPGNRIGFITETQDKTIIIGTNRGIVRYDKSINGFRPILSDLTIVKAHLFCKAEQSIYFWGQNKLYEYNSDTDECTVLYTLTGKTTTPHSSFNSIITGNKKGEFILGTRSDGLLCIDSNNKSIQKLEWYSHSSVMAICKDDKDNIWIAPYDKGIYCYNNQGEELVHFNKQNSGLKQNLVISLMCSDNKIWIGTDGECVAMIDLESMTFNDILLENQGGHKSNTITCFAPNKGRSIWIGSHTDGIFYLKPISIPSYGKSSANSIDGLSEEGINCMYKESDEKIWIGTDGGGINSFNLETKKFIHYPSTSPLKIVSIIPWSENKLLISAFAKGLYFFNVENGSITPFIIANKKVNQDITKSGISINLINFDEKIYILGSENFVYNKNDQTFTVLNQQQEKFPSGMRLISQNDSCAYLISQRAAYKLVFDKDSIQPYYFPNLKGELINTATIDSLGRLWFCIGDGLELWCPQTNTTQLIDKTSKLRISSLIIDNKNNLWIGARNSLYAYSLSNNNLQLFDNAIGYYSNEFHAKSNVITENGDILMGGGAGFIHIPSNTNIASTKHQKLNIGCIHVNGHEINMETEAEIDKNIVNIPYNNNSIQVELLLNNEDIFYNPRFRYYLNNDSPLETSDYRLSLGTLNTGDYSLYVQYTTPSGIWSSPQIIVRFSAQNAWWKELHFIILYLLVIIALIIVAFLAYKRKKIRQHQWELYVQQEKINDQKIKFLVNINHELRTPLTLIYAPLKRVLEISQIKDEVKNLISLSLKHVVRMKHIINMILDLKKLEHGSETLNKEAFLLNQWLENFVQNFCIETEDKGINIVFSLSSEVGIINSDKHKLELIISNLLSNAIKFSPHGSNIDIHTVLSENDVKISIIDEGTGIQGNPESLFEPFYQEKHEHIGTGLGLSYTKEMIELHNGSVGCRNNSDKKGAEFWVTLPLENRCTVDAIDISVPDIPEDNEKGIAAPISLKKLTILIVEDENQLRGFLSNTLKNIFKKVYEATNGETALEIAKNKLPDIIISDVMMPVMDGFTLCKSIKNDSKISHIPIILLTARADDDSVLTGYKLGADHYLAKPFDIDCLLTIIQNTLKLRFDILEKAKHSTIKIEPEIVTFSISDEHFIRVLNEIIEREMDNLNLNIDLIATQMAMSRTSLYKKMNAIIGIGVNNYIVRLRIEKARQLLASTELSIVEISDQLGFSNQRYFCTTFKQEQKITPSQYRKDIKTI